MTSREKRSPSRRRFAVLIAVGTLLWVFSGVSFETPLAEGTESALATAVATFSVLAAYAGAGMALLGLCRLLRSVERHLGVDHDEQAAASVSSSRADWFRVVA